MLVDDKTRKALDIKGLVFPASIKVSKVEAEDYTDWDGEPALRVLVTLDESVEVDKVSGQEVGDLKRAIRESLRKHGVALFPYIFLAKPSELADADEE